MGLRAITFILQQLYNGRIACSLDRTPRCGSQYLAKSMSRKEVPVFMNPEKKKPLSFGQLQEKIDQTVRELGGYWTPLSAFARVSEELGEISEIVLTFPLDTPALTAELADLYIITTCLANQYCVKLSDEYKTLGYNPNQPKSQTIDHTAIDTVEKIVPSLAGQIGKLARILNYYEGQKKKKTTDETKSLREEIAKLHLIIFAVADFLKVDIKSVIEANLIHSQKRDVNRFDLSRDPITEESLEHFQAVIDSTLCPFAPDAKIWGAKAWDKALNFEENITSNLSWLERFAKVCDPEQLDGFVIEVKLDENNHSDLISLGKLLNQTLRVISTNDPAGQNCMDEEIETPTWRFSFGGVTFFISTFSDLYGPDNSRHSPHPGSFFVFFQPEKSFDHHHIHRDNPKRDNIKQNIRQSFKDHHRGYDVALVEQKIEAYKYLKPLHLSELPIKWWEL